MMTSRKYRCRSRNRRTPQGARYCPSGTVAINSVDPRTEVRRLDLPSRQKIEIARAISGNLRILLLDEPTASLSNRDVQWLGDVIERLKRSGTTVVLISHRMQEVRAFCSVLTIFRNGRTVGAHAMNDVADAEIIELMIGRSLGAAFPAKPVRADAEAVAPDSVLSCRNLATAGGGDISFSLCASEVLGLAGLDGMGRDLFLALFGVTRTIAGGIRVSGQEVQLRSPAHATVITIKSLMNYGHPWLDQIVMAEFISGGAYRRHLRGIRRLYQTARDALLTSLKRHLASSIFRGSIPACT
jgi:ABC-type sugar transport system ATPase subunit